MDLAIRTLERGWHAALSELVEQTESCLLIASPFVTQEGSRLIADRLPQTVRELGRLHLLTDLSPGHICDGSLQPVALEQLYDLVNAASLWHIPRLHAKVYIADGRRAIVTSGNLTSGGLFRNLEYGVDVGESRLVCEILDSFNLFQSAGAVISREQLSRYSSAAEEVRTEYLKVQRTASIAAKRALERAVQDAEDELIRFRLAGGAMHTVFAKTIEYLLRTRGALSTVQIHGYVKALHPDLCDDSVDRVIDGEHFGKKWKHAVRTAQQMLKRRGVVSYEDGLWHYIHS